MNVSLTTLEKSVTQSPINQVGRVPNLAFDASNEVNMSSMTPEGEVKVEIFAPYTGSDIKAYDYALATILAAMDQESAIDCEYRVIKVEDVHSLSADISQLGSSIEKLESKYAQAVAENEALKARNVELLRRLEGMVKATETIEESGLYVGDVNISNVDHYDVCVVCLGKGTHSEGCPVGTIEAICDDHNAEQAAAQQAEAASEILSSTLDMLAPLFAAHSLLNVPSFAEMYNMLNQDVCEGCDECSEETQPEETSSTGETFFFQFPIIFGNMDIKE